MFYFTDLHVQLLARSILNPGEQLVGQTSTFYMPWWALGFINRRNLVLATNQRLIVVEHHFGFFPVGYRLKVVSSMPWSTVQECKLKGIFAKKLVVKGVGDTGPVAFKHTIPNTLFGLMAPMKNNLQGGRNIDAFFKSGAAQSQPQLPASQQQPQLPAINAPGYASVPPGAMQGYPAAPQLGQPQQGQQGQYPYS